MLQEDKHTRISPRQDGAQVWEEWRSIVEPIEEDEKEVDEEVDVGEVPPTGDLLPKQVAAPRATLPVPPGFWVVG